MNRLATATSPYLAQHADNPVDWWPWGPEAFAAAVATGKPILLSIGYAACHWCHVMAHESFEDPATAAVMNELFVNIKVDREERPDLDHVYMTALHGLGEPGGWPLTMFLTPQGEPFWGGTYFPPEARWGKPGFKTLLREVARVHAAEPSRIRNNVEALRRHVSRAGETEASAREIPHDLVARLGGRLAAAFDPIDGGLKGAPKFPNSSILEMLWRAQDATGEPAIRAPFLTTLERIALGGIHDHIGGGFARYSVDARWHVPHFEKMLYDNAQLLELYTLGHKLTPRPLFRDAARGIVSWLAREMTLPGGGFAASLDADSEGHEGKFYVWTLAEIEAILGADAPAFARAYNVTREGNWEETNILHRLDGSVPESEIAALQPCRRRLLEARARRIRPGLDDKVLTDWNSLMIAALARSAEEFDHPEWIDLARGAFRFITESMRPGGRLMHGWRDGRFSGPAMALDHAAYARAALALHELDHDPRLLALAIQAADAVETHHADSETGLLAMNATDAHDLFVRPRPTHDDAVPNAHGVHAEVLVRLAEITGEARWSDRAERLFAACGAAVLATPTAHASLINAHDLMVRGATIVVAGSETARLVRAARAEPYPLRIIVPLDMARPHERPDRAALAAGVGEGAAFVCLGRRCSLPIRDADVLPEAIRTFRDGRV